MTERTEEDKLLRIGVTVKLGGQDYQIPPLVIKDARQWRKKLSKLLGKLPSYAAVTTDNPTEFEAAMNALMVTMPDEVMDLFFDYAKGMNRTEIEGMATESEIATAFTEVLSLAFPLVSSLTGALTKLAR